MRATGWQLHNTDCLCESKKAHFIWAFLLLAGVFIAYRAIENIAN